MVIWKIKKQIKTIYNPDENQDFFLNLWQQKLQYKG